MIGNGAQQSEPAHAGRGKLAGLEDGLKLLDDYLRP
jgi:hypothetical protein